MKRLLKTTLFAALAVGATLLAQPSYAQTQPYPGYDLTNPQSEIQTGTINGSATSVTCRSLVRSVSRLYPADNAPVSATSPYGAHYWVCTSPRHAAPADYLQRASVAMGPIGNLTAPVLSLVKTNNLTYYYFQDRADANMFFEKKFGLFVGKLSTTTARCGNTATPTDFSRVIAMVYDTCSYDNLGTTPPNPNPGKIAAHETGHGVDFIYGNLYGGASHTPPSKSAGFKALANGISGYYIGDYFAYTPSNWSVAVGATPAMTAAQKTSYVCNIFKSTLPSDLERAFGVLNERVCLDATPTSINDNSVIGLTNFTTLNPEQIAEKRFPYFFDTSELFAELFSKRFGSIPSPNPLAMTDAALVTGHVACKTVSGSYVCPTYPYPNQTNLLCTDWVVREFFFNAAPPPAFATSATNSLKGKGCPDQNPSNFTHP